MALIKCPECDKDISDKAECCPHCGCPAKYWQSVPDEISEEYLDEIYEETNGKKTFMIKKVSEDCNISLVIAKEKVDKYWNKRFPQKELHYTPQKPLPEKARNPKHEFTGVYRSTLLGKLQEVYCPRCGSENCSHYQEQKIVPGKTKTRYTVNLNPLGPFTLVNKKEKVVRQEQVMTENKFVCNSCGKIFY